MYIWNPPLESNFCESCFQQPLSHVIVMASKLSYAVNSPLYHSFCPTLFMPFRAVIDLIHHDFLFAELKITHGCLLVHSYHTQAVAQNPRD